MRHTELAVIAGAVLLASTALAGAQIAPIAATPAPNTVAASASAPPMAGSSDYKTAMICRSMPAQTGSLLAGAGSASRNMTGTSSDCRPRRTSRIRN